MFLCDSEIRRLTGKQRYSAQIRWLRNHGYRYEVNGLKQPIVAAAKVARKLVGGSQERRAEPRWEMMSGAAA